MGEVRCLLLRDGLSVIQAWNWKSDDDLEAVVGGFSTDWGRDYREGVFGVW